MAHFDLEDTYLSFDGQGGLRTHPVAGFWETVDTNTDLLGTMVSAFVSTGRPHRSPDLRPERGRAHHDRLLSACSPEPVDTRAPTFQHARLAGCPAS